MHTNPARVLSAVTLVAALGLAGCGEESIPVAPTMRPTLDTPQPSVPAAAPLPSPDVLTGVLYRLSDTSVPAAQKIGLVQFATVDDQAALQNFGEALKAGGFDPLVISAMDLAWAGDPGHVIANITIASAVARVKPFTYPMEFSPIRDTWQLARRTADQLLPLFNAAR